MTDETPDIEKLSMTNTKKEMLQAYNKVLKKLTEKRRAELKPVEAATEKKQAETKAVADSLSTEGIGRQIGLLKSDIGKTLNDVADRLEEETSKYAQVKRAVETAEAELQEIYEIEKAASTLAALLEAERQQREEFDAETTAAREEMESEMAEARQEFDNVISSQREEWKKEKTKQDATAKEQGATEKKRREREREEYQYEFEREKQLAREQYEHEKATLDREIQSKRETLERELSDRENAVAVAEVELKQLREYSEQFPGELEKAVARATKETSGRLEREGQNKIDLLQKEYEGERNVLKSRIEALQETVSKQAEQVGQLSQQLEHSYRQVQDIAVKAIEGPSATRPAGGVHATAGPEATPRGGPDER